MKENLDKMLEEREEEIRGFIQDHLLDLPLKDNGLEMDWSMWKYQLDQNFEQLSEVKRLRNLLFGDGKFVEIFDLGGDFSE